MSYKLRVALLALLALLLPVSPVAAQKQYQENPVLTEMWKELDGKFRQTYLVRQTNDWIIYDLSYWFKSESDRRAHRQTFDRLFAGLDKLKTLRKFTESVDEEGTCYTKYTLTTRSGRKGQIDFIQLEVGNSKVSFQYKVNADVNGKRQAVSAPVAEAIRKQVLALYGRYTSRRGAAKQQVTYDWDRHKYHRCIAADNTTKLTRATRYTISGCTKRDYEQLCTLFRQMQQKYNVFLTVNDVFWEYEETAIAFRDHNGKLVNYGVALKPDGTLCLIESRAGALPRLWAEDNAEWKECLKTRPHYKTPENKK